jgi:hypothetical protein
VALVWLLFEPTNHEPRELLTVLNVPLMRVPRLLTIVTQATMIRASITAYSSAAGPCSLTRKRRIFAIRLFIVSSLV